MSPRLRRLRRTVSQKMQSPSVQKMPSLWLPGALPMVSPTRLLGPVQCSVCPRLPGQVSSLWSSGCASRDRLDGDGQGDGCTQWQHAPRRSGDPMANPLRHQPAMERDHVASARPVLHPKRQVEAVPGHLWRWQAKWCEADPMDTPWQRKPALSISQDEGWKPLDCRRSLWKGVGCARWKEQQRITDYPVAEARRCQPAVAVGEVKNKKT